MQKAGKTDQIESIWQMYQQTLFYWVKSVPAFQSFAIITAHNPVGKILTIFDNKKRHLKLINRVEQMNCNYAGIVGTSPDYQHQELGLAVEMELRTAQVLAKEFEQNAIYFVEKDEIRLIPCGLSQCTSTPMGSFASRLVVSASVNCSDESAH